MIPEVNITEKSVERASTELGVLVSEPLSSGFKEKIFRL